MLRCVGFGGMRGRCPRPASRLSPYWCDECLAIRMAGFEIAIASLAAEARRAR